MVCLMVGNKSDLKQYRSLKCRYDLKEMNMDSNSQAKIA